jgi:hypothetical protein
MKFLRNSLSKLDGIPPTKFILGSDSNLRRGAENSSSIGSVTGDGVSVSGLTLHLKEKVKQNKKE